MTDSELWHRLSEVDRKTRAATCSICGPTTIRLRSSGGTECMTARRANRGRGGKSKTSPQAARRYNLRRRYNLDDEALDALTSPVGACPICARTERRLHVDHDHRCCPGKTSCGACVRGAICGPCNRILAHYRDDQEVFLRAAAYLGHGHNLRRGSPGRPSNG